MKIHYTGHPTRRTEQRRSKEEEEFRKVYGIYPQTDEQLLSFIKSRKAEKDFSKYDRFHTEK